MKCSDFFKSNRNGVERSGDPIHARTLHEGRVKKPHHAVLGGFGELVLASAAAVRLPS